MADEPDMKKLEEEIKALKKRSEALNAEVDETHKAAEAAKAQAAASSNDLDKIKQRK